MLLCVEGCSGFIHIHYLCNKGVALGSTGANDFCSFSLMLIYHFVFRFNEENNRMSALLNNQT